MPAPTIFHGDYRDLPNLASEKVGARVLEANDDFFAPKENLILASTPIFIPDKYIDTGKWMDGWETRRRRTPGHDWCVVQLGFSGVISGFNIDTAHFLGNYPEHASIEGCYVEGSFDPARAEWKEILPKSALGGGKENLFAIRDDRVFSHLRLNIFPDGGVARLRVHGQAKPDWSKLLPAKQPLDLAAMALGAEVVVCNDMFFGSKDNLILPGRSGSMADGWETKRKRVPGHDWTVVKLARPGKVERVEVDTHHFKGNYPDRCSLEGCFAPSAQLEELRSGAGIRWTEILPNRSSRRTPSKSTNVSSLPRAGPQSLPTCGSIFFQTVASPGSVFTASRRCNGVRKRRAWDRWFNALPRPDCETELARVCSAMPWFEQ